MLRVFPAAKNKVFARLSRGTTRHGVTRQQLTAAVDRRAIDKQLRVCDLTTNIMSRRQSPTSFRSSRNAIWVTCFVAAVGCSDDPVTMSPPRPVSVPDAAMQPPQPAMPSTMAGSSSATPAAMPAATAGTGAAGNNTDTRDGSMASHDAGAFEDEDAGAAPIPDAGIPDAGGPATFTPTCEKDTYVWNLAPGFLLAEAVEYVADREIRFTETMDVNGVTVSGPVNYVISSAGTPCGGASDKDKCMKALEVVSLMMTSRHLVTTRGDEVRLWPDFSALSVLGQIDTPAEAIWWLQIRRGGVPCGAKAEKADEGGYTVHGAEELLCWTSDGSVWGAAPQIRPNGDIIAVWPDGGDPCAPPADPPPP